MPNYSFGCFDCGVFDEIVPIGIETVKCKCGKTAQRLFSPTSNLNMGEWRPNKERPDWQAYEKYTDWEKGSDTQYRVKHGELAYEQAQTA